MTNHFTGSPLNRLSWLRSSHSFLNAIIQSPQSRWILFNNGNPLIPPSSDPPSLPYLSTQDLRPLLGPQPYFTQTSSPTGDDQRQTPNAQTDAVRLGTPRIVFLGIHEASPAAPAALPSSTQDDFQILRGTPYFAMDVSDLADESLVRSALVARTAGEELVWSESRLVLSTLDGFTAAVVACAKSLVDWNLRNKFCPGCGSRTYSMWGGWKIACSSLLPGAEPTDKPCITAKGLHNFMHPRTDVVVIMVAIDERYDKIFLGRGRKFPGNFYSALAGFIEPGESLEDAVAREVLEEAGLRVWDVKYHSGQPWPYPANLMIGFYARADSTEPIRIDLDQELSDARWFTRQEVISVLEHPNGSRQQGASNSVEREKKSADEPPSFKFPSAVAIAGVLIREWIAGKLVFQPKTDQETALKKGNL